MSTAAPRFHLLAVLYLILSTQLVAVAFSVFTSGSVEYLVHYEEDPTVLDDLSIRGCRVLRLYKAFSIALVECPNYVESAHRDKVFPNLEVTKAELNLRVVGSLSKLGSQSGEYVTAWSWAISRVGADMVWNYLRVAGNDIVVAVLDTGVDPEHPLLLNKLVTVNPLDPTYPGGWIEFDRRGRPVCSKPRDTDGHGTWVSSIIVGGDTSTYIFGVIPNAKLMVAGVLPGGYGTFAQVLAGLEWVLKPYDCYKRYVDAPRPVVVSMSLGALGNYSNLFLPAIEKLLNAGIVVVAAIGNGGPYISSNPGNIWGVIGVGATDFNDRVAYFSSYEEVEWPSPPTSWPFKGQYPKSYAKPDVVAPGVKVPGAYPGGLLAIGSGTSASTPLVAGIAALVASELRNKGLSGPSLVEAVYDALTATASPLNQPGSGYGRVRAYLAIAKVMNIPVRIVPTSVSPTSAQPTDTVRVLTGITPGSYVDIYISGVRVYSGSYAVGGVTVTVPLTHIGGNTVTVVSSDGRSYGETLVFVNPSISLASNMTSGQLYDITISGLGLGDLVAVYIAGNTLLLDRTNLRGSLRTKVLAPYVSEPRSLHVVVEDLSMPGVYLSTLVSVSPPMPKAEAVEGPEAVLKVNVKSYYVVNYRSTIEVLLPHEGFNVSLKQVYPEHPVLRVINVSHERNITVFTIEVTDYPSKGVAFIEVQACYAGSCAKSIESLNVVSVDPLKPIASAVAELQKAISDLRDSLRFEQEKSNEVRQALSKLNLTVVELSASLSKVSSIVADLGQAIYNVSYRIAQAESQVNKLAAENVVQRLEKVEGRVEELSTHYSRAFSDLSKLTIAASTAFVVSLLALLLALLSLVRLSRTLLKHETSSELRSYVSP
ncbi:MAG: S8 family serine peptidase [Sulfolobales archaeon]